MNGKKQIFISAKMRGVPYYNFPAFDAARDRLQSLGLEPWSPADADRKEGFDPLVYVDFMGRPASKIDWSITPPGFDLDAAIARDNAAIDDPDTVAVYVLHEGFADSAGATAEVERGMKAGKTILFDTMSDERILRVLGMVPTLCTRNGLCEERADIKESLMPGSPMRSARGLAMLHEEMKNKAAKDALAVMNVHGCMEKKAAEELAQPLTDALRTFFTDPATGGRKETKLARFDLVPPDILWELAEHYGKGSIKYGERNMEKGYPWSKTYAACHRHLNAFWQGEDMDAETKSLHLIAAAWHCFTMAWFLRHGAGTDDRPNTKKKGKVS